MVGCFNLIRVWIAFDKTVLEYIISNQQGRRCDIEEVIGYKNTMELNKVKLIRLGLLKWTKLAFVDDLYISKYGYLPYLCLFLKSNKMIKRISNFFMQWLNTKSMTPTAMFPIA